jgi:hypothetical protein
MKTERMVLLVTPEEKNLINERAAAMNVSASEFVRRAVELFDPDDVAALAELEAMLPELEAMAERIEREKAEWPRIDAEREAERAYFASEEYREAVRQQILADPNIDWDRARKVFSGNRQVAA